MKLLGLSVIGLAIAILVGFWAVRRAERCELNVAQLQAITVQIRSRHGTYGTGVIVASKQYGWAILTAAHVALEGNCEAVQQRPDGSTHRYLLEVVAINHPRDVAIMRPVGHVRPPRRLAEISANEPIAGEKVLHYGGIYGEMTFSTGVVATPKSTLSGQIYVKLSDIGAPGSSGGGVFDRRGRLLAIVTHAKPGILTWATPAAVAIPML